MHRSDYNPLQWDTLALAMLLVAGCGAPSSQQSSSHDAGNLDASSVAEPAAESLSFTCALKNIDALGDQNPDLEIPCSLHVLDANGEEILDAGVHFLAEAGAFSFDTAANTWAYFPFHVGPGNVSGASPLDVAPAAAFSEPSYVDTSDPNLPTRNPRDGLTTLVAYVPAAPDAVARNAGAYAPYGAAPFVDVDDSGSWHPGDAFLDLNEDGVYAATQDSILWKQIKVLWTGPVKKVSTLWNGASVGSPVDIMPPGMGTLSITAVDVNLNLTSAGDASAFRCTPSSVVSAEMTSPSAPASAPFGFEVDDNFNIVAGTAWEIGAVSQVSFVCPTGTAAVPFSCSVGGQVVITGTVEACP
jgi:hypothetical protein